MFPKQRMVTAPALLNVLGSGQGHTKGFIEVSSEPGEVLDWPSSEVLKY